jgi:hypothetical protein
MLSAPDWLVGQPNMKSLTSAATRVTLNANVKLAETGWLSSQGRQCAALPIERLAISR